MTLELDLKKLGSSHQVGQSRKSMWSWAPACQAQRQEQPGCLSNGKESGIAGPQSAMERSRALLDRRVQRKAKLQPGR